MALLTVIKLFRGVLANLPILQSGEIAFTTDSHQIFVGDGVTNWPIGGGSTVNPLRLAPITGYPIAADNVDPTKHLAFVLSDISPATTRSATWQDASGTVPYLELTQSWSAVQTFDASPTSPDGADSERWGAGATAAAANCLALGAAAAATGPGCVAIGTSATASGASSVGTTAIGHGASATGDIGGGGSVVIGGGSASSGSNNVVVGALQSTSSNNSVLVGSANAVSGGGNYAYGVGNSVGFYGSACFGFFNTVTHNSVFAIGNLLTSVAPYELVLGYGSASGTGSSTAGMAIRCQAQRSDTTMASVGRVRATWSDPTVGSEKGAMALTAFDPSGERTGLEAGTDGTQPLVGLFGVTPVAQPTSIALGTTGFVANASANAVFAESTFTGGVGATAYTISDIVRAMKLLGAIAP